MSFNRIVLYLKNLLFFPKLLSIPHLDIEHQIVSHDTHPGPDTALSVLWLPDCVYTVGYIVAVFFFGRRM